MILVERTDLETIVGALDWAIARDMPRRDLLTARNLAAGYLGEQWNHEHPVPAAASRPAKPCAAALEGWYCTRNLGHDGPCAALPIDPLGPGTTPPHPLLEKPQQ